MGTFYEIRTGFPLSPERTVENAEIYLNELFSEHHLDGSYEVIGEGVGATVEISQHGHMSYSSATELSELVTSAIKELSYLGNMPIEVMSKCDEDDGMITNWVGTRRQILAAKIDANNQRINELKTENVQLRNRWNGANNTKVVCE